MRRATSDLRRDDVILTSRAADSFARTAGAAANRARASRAVVATSGGTWPACIAKVLGPRVLVLHDHLGLLQAVGRVCLRHQAPLQLARSQSELLEILTRRKQAPDLVIAKDVVREDWYTVAAVLMAARAD